MADGVSINIKNNTEIRNLLRAIPEKLKASAYDVIEEEIAVAVTEAKANAGRLSVTGELQNGIRSVRDGKKVYYLSDAPYSAFVEFGIRSGYRRKPGFEKGAMRFKGVSNIGSAKSAKENIYEWAGKVGIDKKYWWPIYRQIMTKGFPSSSGRSRLYAQGGFFIQPYYDARNRIGRKLKSILKRAFK